MGFIATDPTVRIRAVLMIGKYDSFNELIDYLIDEIFVSEEEWCITKCHNQFFFCSF